MMSAKQKTHPLNAAHTAGIFADPSIDGPHVGTIVLVVDRAKNLPNRKTIGKQDPYCAARLGKEAKKTTTDIRGGQTPKWDQELRFAVHDCPDYYQLKVSVFNDDKKTELIGEAWIDLRDILVPGGGQSDQWHTLNCKGKYAGDIRIEITYYDSRPKPERPAVKPKPAPDHEIPRDPLNRRPLPSNPITGQPAVPSVPEHTQTPPRPRPNPPAAYIPSQSPLQSVEYNTPPPAPVHREDRFSPAPPSGGYATPSRMDLPQHHRSVERHDKYPLHAEEPDFSSPDFQAHDYDRHDLASRYDDAPVPFSLPEIDGRERSLPPDDDRPPPPPVHRSRNTSSAPPLEVTPLRGSFDMSPTKATPPLRQDVLRNEAHRHSTQTAYPGRPTYRPYDSTPAPLNTSQHSTPESHQPSPPRHHSYDSSYDRTRGTPPAFDDSFDSSPGQPMRNSFQQSGSRMPKYDHGEPDFGPVPSPAPLNLSGRGSAASGHHNTNQWPHEPIAFSSSPPQMAPQDYPRTSPGPSPYDSRGSQHSSHRHEFDDNNRAERHAPYALPPIPPTLVPGVDPGLALELSSRIHEDRRHQRRHTAQNVSTPPRGRQMIEGPPSNYDQGSSPQSFGTPQHSFDRRSFDRSPITYSGGPSPAMVKPRGLSPRPSPEPSPNHHHTIKRKSVSPAPPTEARRLSGVPFGPDSYDSLNPSMVSTSSKESAKSVYTDPNDKIITHDGREVDPSDHLPVSSWAPEPEPKRPTTSHSGGHSGPNSGRKPLRVVRPGSNSGPQYITPEADSTSPTTPTGGRNRLQKKAGRASQLPPPILPSPVGLAAEGSSPLAPLPQPHHGDNFTPPRSAPLPLVPGRANGFDFQNENHAPVGVYHGNGGGSRGAASAPPIPAKIPLGGGHGHGYGNGSGQGSGHGHGHGHGGSGGYGGYGGSAGRSGGRSGGGGGGGPTMMSGAMPAPQWNGGGGGDRELSLAEEMSMIDIGTGRARRHQSRY